jgi:hypothetical protein
MLIRKRLNFKENKKANIDFSPAILVAVIIVLLLLAPIIIRIIGITTGTFFAQMNQSYPDAVAPADKAVETVYNFFDYLIVIAMFINIIVLFISAWFIDTNPIFIVLYIMFAFIFFLFVPNLLNAVDTIWGKMEDASVHDPWRDDPMPLDFTDFIRRNMMMFTLLVIAFTGLLIYAKFKITQGQFT